jgi:hypothetical protein
VSHNPSWGCRNQKWQVALEAGGAGARGGGARVEMGLTKGRKSSFKQSYPRVSSTLEKRHGINGGHVTHQHGGA